MSQAATFQWHPDARLFVAGQEVPRRGTGQTGFAVLPCTPCAEALSQLGTALLDRRPFCLSDTTLPAGVSATPHTFLTQSGGSTGAPRLIRRTHASWIASFEVNANRFNIKSTDRLAVLGALSHSLALYGVLEGLHLGTDVHVLACLTPGTQGRHLLQSGVMTLYATPTQLRLLPEAQFPDLRLILCGGGALDEFTAQRIRSQCPNAALYAFYGAAETSFIAISDADTPLGSVGQPYPEVEIRIDDEGIVRVRSPYLCDGYAGGEPLDMQEGFVTVGEVGRQDAQGNLWIMGRADRMISVADENLHPETVETCITSLDGVTHCAVLPRPDATRGQQLVAVIDGAQDDAKALHIRNTCRSQLGPRLTPRSVCFHPSFPLLPSGKPDLTALAEWLEGAT